MTELDKDGLDAATAQIPDGSSSRTRRQVAVDAISAYLAVADGWRDISTAPKDGRYFIGYWPCRAHGFIAHQGQYRTRWTEWGGGCWEGDALGRPSEGPAKWRPLPSPPKEG